jgi:hypothetical protein
MNPYKRYRVSSQRMSKKPVNVEFVLTIDTEYAGSRAEAVDLVRLLRRTEDEALSSHSDYQCVTVRPPCSAV